MTKLVRRSILIALIPALALATPKPAKKKPIKKPKATTTTPTASEPATTPPDPTDAADPTKDKDAKPVTSTAPPPQTTPATPAGGAGGTGSGGGAGGGGADKAPEPAASVPLTDPDVDTLRQEYLSLRDELFKSRARASTIASQLYSTRIQIMLTYTTARFYSPAKASIRLDGASVYENTSGAIAGDDGVRFAGYVAPGRHLVTFHVEATGKDDDTFASTTETQIVVKAVAGKDLIVAAKAKDGGDIAYEWKRSEHGSYGLGIDVSIKTTARADEAKGARK